jgi:peptidoglycan/LPS O-acetylase OafA/YrhL
LTIGRLPWKISGLSFSAIVAAVIAGSTLFTGNTRTGLYVFLLTDNWQFLWGYSVVNFVGLLFIKGAMEGTLWCNYFNWRPVEHIGKISYGMYLFHLPIATFLALAWPHATLMTHLAFAFTVLILTFGLAHISFTWFESPINRLKARYT